MSDTTQEVTADALGFKNDIDRAIDDLFQTLDRAAKRRGLDDEARVKAVEELGYTDLGDAYFNWIADGAE